MKKFSPYEPPTPEEIAASPTLSRYALLARLVQEGAAGSGANTDPAAPPLSPTSDTYSAVEPESRAPATADGPHQRGDIVRGPDGKLRLVKQAPGP